MSDVKQVRTVPPELFSAVLTYLGSRPFKEVAPLMNSLSQVPLTSIRFDEIPNNNGQNNDLKSSTGSVSNGESESGGTDKG
jgi:hypothetical protein